MIEILVDKITGLISTIGYPGIFFLMFLESTLVPLPAELVMPFAGFLVALGKMSLLQAIIAAMLGTLSGSLFGYWLGYRFSSKIVKKFGKYLLMHEGHLNQAQKWFKRHGNKTIFFSRFVPGVRHVISIPAGAGKMNLLKFSIFTLLGAGIWNSFLLYLGYTLQKNWEIVYQYTEIVDLFVYFIVIALITYYVYNILKARKIKVKTKRKK